MHSELLAPSETVSFADVAHQTLTFSRSDATDNLVLDLIDTKWVQRLRRISQTGNTRLVYMFAEHTRFGHSLGVAYLACELMRKLSAHQPEVISPYQDAVAGAAILHDIGHVAPGSHLAERVWATDSKCKHEQVSIRAICEDEEIRSICNKRSEKLLDQITAILADDDSMPQWTRAIISGAGWNADRGNWAIVDSAMCAVNYGRYNVSALLDAFRLTDSGELVLQESRLDALTHFFVARDSMYRQIYQHRVLQAVDVITCGVVERARSLLDQEPNAVFADDTMIAALRADNYATDLELESLFEMSESWWGYHLEKWCLSSDNILSDLAARLRDRLLFKTVRLPKDKQQANSLIADAKSLLSSLGLDPKYYFAIIDEIDAHRASTESPPYVLLDTGEISPVTEVEPLIAQIIKRKGSLRRWMAIPEAVKQSLGVLR